jgi:hypothetical protein
VVAALVVPSARSMSTPTGHLGLEQPPFELGTTESIVASPELMCPASARGSSGCDAVHNAGPRRVSFDEGRVSIDFEQGAAYDSFKRAFESDVLDGATTRPARKGVALDATSATPRPASSTRASSFHGARLRGDEPEKPHVRREREPRRGELPLRLQGRAVQAVLTRRSTP